MLMEPIARLIVCLCMLFVSGNIVIQPAMAQGKPMDPVINLTVKDEPLADVLETIAQETGYQFNLSPQWEDHPVSATINNLPLEQGLKRLLRSLNHTIIWEANKTVTIKVYGKVTPGSSGGISFAAPPQTYQEEDEQSIEPDDEQPAENEETTDRESDNPPESIDRQNQETDGPEDAQPARAGRPPAGAAIKKATSPRQPIKP
jgi:type II secretory pathway component GspD/PulD (secretin)